MEQRRRLTAVASTLALVLVLAGTSLFFFARDGTDDEPRAAATAAASVTPAAAPSRRSLLERLQQSVRPPPGVEIDQVAALLPGSAVEGRVVSSTSARGIEGAELTFFHAGTASSVVSGRGGRFEATLASPGAYELGAAVAPGFMPFAPPWGQSPIAFVAREGQRIAGIVVRLVPAVVYQGRAIDREGRPVAGARIVLLGEAGGDADPIPVQDNFTSGPDGRFVFNAHPGDVLKATHPDYSPGRGTVDMVARMSKKLDIVLEPRSAGEESAECSLRGRVLDSAGEPLAGALVEARGGRGYRAIHRAESGDSGEFSISGLSRGHYEVRATFRDFAPAKQSLEVTGDHELELRLGAGSRLAGVVRADGRPVTAFLVWVGLETGPLSVQSYTSRSFYGSDGAYEIGGLIAGRYRVVVLAEGFAPARTGGIEIGGAEVERVDFELSSGGRLLGIVRDERSGSGVLGAMVNVEGGMTAPMSSTEAAVHAGAATAVTDAAGGFELRGLAPGLRSVWIEAEGYDAAIASGIEIAEGSATGPVEFSITPVAPGGDPTLELVGIGISIRPEGEMLEVMEAVEGGSAGEAGLSAGDKILRVDGTPVTEIGFEGAIERIRGRPGTTVQLSIQKHGSGETVELSIPRRKVRL